jgi:hypothetical protein
MTVSVVLEDAAGRRPLPGDDAGLPTPAGRRGTSGCATRQAAVVVRPCSVRGKR